MKKDIITLNADVIAESLAKQCYAANKKFQGRGLKDCCAAYFKVRVQHAKEDGEELGFAHTIDEVRGLLLEILQGFLDATKQSVDNIGEVIRLASFDTCMHGGHTIHCCNCIYNDSDDRDECPYYRANSVRYDSCDPTVG